MSFYVASTAYDEAGRVVLQKIGGTSALQKQFTYFAWNTPNGQGRLKQIKAGTSAYQDSLLDLRYYIGTNTPEGVNPERMRRNAVGNIKKIYDYAFGDFKHRQRSMGSPQTQTFTYDNLDRLTSAQASGGTNGNYASESYTYNTTTGNLATKAGISYTLRRAQGRLYGDSNHPHAVMSLSNRNMCVYDSNGDQMAGTTGGTIYVMS